MQHQLIKAFGPYLAIKMIQATDIFLFLVIVVKQLAQHNMVAPWWLLRQSRESMNSSPGPLAQKLLTGIGIIVSMLANGQNKTVSIVQATNSTSTTQLTALLSMTNTLLLLILRNSCYWILLTWIQHIQHFMICVKELNLTQNLVEVL